MTMRHQRGYNLVEVLVALVILAIVITTTIAMFARRQQYLRESSETILAWQAIWNEAEIWRHVAWTSIGSEPAFRSDTTILAPLAPFATKVDVTPSADDPNVKSVNLTVLWDFDDATKVYRRNARLIVLRSDTGGSNLW
jgi:prepilin-type N-terminal cleavage/methylation domain-containing protein